MLKSEAIGNLGRDAELRTLDNGKTITTFRLAAETGYGDNAKTEWLDCVIRGPRGEAMVESLTKGTRLYITGRSYLKTYTSRSGELKTVLTVEVQDLEFLGGGAARQDDAGGND